MNRLFITNVPQIAEKTFNTIKAQSIGDNISYNGIDTYIILIKGVFEIELNGKGRWLYKFSDGIEDITATVDYKSANEIKSIKESIEKYQIEEVVNFCTSNSKGQLLFEVLMKCLNLNSDESKRIWLRENTVNSRVVKNLLDNSEYKQIAISLLCEIILDKYWNYRSKDIYQGYPEVSLNELMILNLLVEREKQIKKKEDLLKNQRDFFRLELFIKDIKFRWLNKEKEDRIYSREQVEDILKHIKDKKVFIMNFNREKSKKKNPLQFNTSDLYNELKKRRLGELKEIREALNSLFEKGYITNPDTESRHLPLEYIEKTKVILSGLYKTYTYEKYIRYIKKQEDIELSSRVFNNALVDTNHAIVITEKIPETGDLRELESAIYDVIVKRFLSIFMGEAEKYTINISGMIGDDSNNYVKYENEEEVRYGWQLLDFEEEEYFEASRIEEENAKKDLSQKDYGIEAGELYEIEKKEIVISSMKSRLKYTVASLIEMLETYGRIIRDEKIKVRRRKLGLGVEEDRSIIINNMVENEMIHIDTDRVFITEIGKEIVKRTPEMILSKTFLESFNRRIKGIQENKENIRDVIRENARFMVKAVKDKQNRKESGVYDYKTLIQGKECPYCHKQLEEKPGYISCVNCVFMIKKVLCDYTLTAKDICDLIDYGITDVITGFTFQNGKPKTGKAQLRINENNRVQFYFDNINR